MWASLLSVQVFHTQTYVPLPPIGTRLQARCVCVRLCVYMRTLRLPLFDASLCLECNCCCFFICPSQCALKVFLNSKSWTHTNLTHRISPFILFAMFLTFIRLSSFLSFPFLLCLHYTLWATLMLPALMLSLLLLLTFYHKMVGNAEVIV